MAVKETCAVLFIFSLVLFPALISSNDLCARPTANFTDANTDFVITVSPTTQNANTVYNVTVNGTGPIDLILQAVYNETSVGNWTEGTTCNNKGILLQNVVLPKTVHWNSTTNLSPVIISAYINYTSKYIKISKELTAATTVSPPTTNGSVATQNSTTQTPGTSATKATSVTVSKTTSGGSVVNPSSMLMALIQSLGLLLISVKLLS